jgi:hypothetical protein
MLFARRVVFLNRVVHLPFSGGSTSKGGNRMQKIITFLLVLFFVLTLPMALLMFDMGRVIFDAPLVKRVVSREVTESDLVR